MLDREGRAKLEKSIIGSMLFDERAIGAASTRVTAEDFNDSLSRTLFTAICDLHFSGAVVSTLTVQSRLGTTDDVAEGIWQTYVPFAVNRDIVPSYCDLLAEDSRLQSLRLIGLRLSGAETLEDASGIVEELNATMIGRGNVKPMSALELIAEFVSRRGTQRQKPEYLSFGIKALDETLMVDLGDVVVLGGYASAGKTLLSLQFALAMAKKYRVGYFSLETSTKKLGNRQMAHLLGVSLKSIKTWDNSPEEYDRAIAIGTEMSANKGCLEYIEAAQMSVRDIQAYALSYRYNVVFVDYLQIVQGKGDNAYARVSDISLALHTMAQKHKITVVALAQLARPERVGGKRGELAPPNMWSFKESGQIENDADVAMLLYPDNPDDYRSDRHLKVSKNKDGEKADFYFKFSGATQTMTFIPPSLASQLAAMKKAEREAQKEAEKLQVSFDELPEDDGDLPF